MRLRRQFFEISGCGAMDKWIIDAAKEISKLAKMRLHPKQVDREAVVTLKHICDILHRNGFMDADYYTECDWGEFRNIPVKQ